MANESGQEFDWADGVEFDITDEKSIVEHFNKEGSKSNDAVVESDAPLGQLDDALVVDDTATPEQAPEEEKVNPDLDSFLDEALKDFASEPEKEQQQSEQKSEEPAEPKNFEALSKDFETAVGVPIKEAIEYARNFETTAQNITNTIQQAEANLALRMQEMELKVAWSQDAMQAGADLDDLVQQRLDQAAKVYQQLSPERQAQVARAGSKGVITLWRHVQGKRTAPAHQVPKGRADIANPSNDAPSLSQVVAIEDEEKYWQAMDQYYKGNLKARNDLS